MIDSTQRIYVIEGISSKAISQLSEKFPFDFYSDIKIFRNPEILFKQRSYKQININIKKVSLAMKLSDLIMKPQIYNRQKVDVEVQNTLMNLNTLKIMPNLQTIINMNLIPDISGINKVQIYFSKDLTYEDIYGAKKEKQKKIKKKTQFEETNDNNSSTLSPNLNLSMDEHQISQFLSPETTGIKSNQINDDTYHLSKSVPYRKSKKIDEFEVSRKSKISYTVRTKKSANFDDKKEYFYYSGQKQNHYQLQLQDLREKIQKDKNTEYTYSDTYKSLSIIPYDDDDIKKQQMHLKKQSPMKFRKIKPIDKLDAVQKEALKYPYHMMKKEEFEFKQDKRALPINDPNKEEFQVSRKNIQPENLGFISASTAQELIDSKLNKIKEKEEFMKKLCGSPSFNNVYQLKKPTRYDQLKGMLKGIPQKQGFQLSNSQINKSNITLSKYLNDSPISMFSPNDQQPKKQIIYLQSLKLDSNTAKDIMYQSPVYKPSKKNTYYTD